MPRPDAAALDGSSATSRLNRPGRSASPRPGRTALHRLNRAEYANAIRDLLALDIDATALLPPDDESSGFDNIAGRADRVAVADGAVSLGVLEHQPDGAWATWRHAATGTYRVRPDLSQDQHIDGLPPGTRGGLVIEHRFRWTPST
jgi:hypothetical protein